MDAVGFAASVFCCDSGSAESAGCCVLMLFPLSLSSTCHLHRGPCCPSSPWLALLLTLLWAGPRILLDLGLLEQTSHSCCLWQLLYA